MSVSTLAFVCYKVNFAFRKHYMNIFTYLMLILICFALLMRSFFFFTEFDVFIGPNPDDDGREELKDESASFALVWTYPLINFIVASYTISSHWCYDLMLLLHGNMGIAMLRR